MGCNVKVSLWKMTGDDESNRYNLELNLSQCDNTLWDFTGWFGMKRYGTGKDTIGRTGHNRLLLKATKNNRTGSVKTEQFSTWNYGMGRGVTGQHGTLK